VHAPLTALLGSNTLSQSQLPTMIIWGREDDVFDAATFSDRFKRLLPHAEGPHLVTGRHFLQEDTGIVIAGLIRSYPRAP
jgi:pimeloyl-ACP methyl ester carboxylesterase